MILCMLILKRHFSDTYTYVHIYERERLAFLQHSGVNIVYKAYFLKMSIHITKVLIILAIGHFTGYHMLSTWLKFEVILLLDNIFQIYIYHISLTIVVLFLFLKVNASKRSSITVSQFFGFSFK